MNGEQSVEAILLGQRDTLRRMLSREVGLREAAEARVAALTAGRVRRVSELRELRRQVERLTNERDQWALACGEARSRAVRAECALAAAGAEPTAPDARVEVERLRAAGELMAHALLAVRFPAGDTPEQIDAQAQAALVAWETALAVALSPAPAGGPNDV